MKISISVWDWSLMSDDRVRAISGLHLESTCLHQILFGAFHTTVGYD